MKQEYIAQLQSWRIWSMKDLLQLTKNPFTARELMRNYISRGIVCSARRDLFVASDLATGLPIPGRYEIGSKIAKDAYIAYHSALEYHGIAQQVSFVVQVCSEKKFRPFSFDNQDYNYCYSAFEEGVIVPAMDTFVRVTNIERTIVDCINRVELSGGWEELLSSLEMIYKPNFHSIERYLSKYNKKTLYAKTGMIAELFSTLWNTPTAFLEKCRQNSNCNLNYFTSKEDSIAYYKKWNIYLPSAMHTYITHDSI